MESIELIKKERQRQIEIEGFTPDSDKQLKQGELALAGIAYASPIPLFQCTKYPNGYSFTDIYPWTGGIGDKRKDYGTIVEGDKLPHPDTYNHLERLDLLVKGAALIAAEIDKLLNEHIYGK